MSRKAKRFSALSQIRWSVVRGKGNGGEGDCSVREGDCSVREGDCSVKEGEGSGGVGDGGGVNSRSMGREPEPEAGQKAEVRVETAVSEPEPRENSVTDSELSSEGDTSTETPQKIHKLDSEFVLSTPDRRCLAEFPSSSNGAYVGQTSQLQAFIEQINATSNCATPGCNGQLEPVTIILTGLGGAVEIQYDCTGCTKRQVQFNSSAVHEASQQTAVGVALQVSFIAAGCTHAQYEKVLAHALGMCSVSHQQFEATLERMYPHVKCMVDEQCREAKEAMKQRPSSELGSFQNAVTIADGAWMTRGFHSQNFTFQIRSYINGALLFYIHLCQRGRDDLCEGELYEGTSKFAEGHAALVLFGKAKEEGMVITTHWQDADSSSALSVREHYPNAKLMLCGGHAARAHQKILKVIKTKKTFSGAEKVPCGEVSWSGHC